MLTGGSSCYEQIIAGSSGVESWNGIAECFPSSFVLAVLHAAQEARMRRHVGRQVDGQEVKSDGKAGRQEKVGHSSSVYNCLPLAP